MKWVKHDLLIATWQHLYSTMVMPIKTSFIIFPLLLKQLSQGSQTHAGKIYGPIKVANYNKAFAHLKFVFTLSGLVEVLYKTHYHPTWFACNYHHGPHALKFEMKSSPSLIWICFLFRGILKHWGWGLHCKWWLYFYIGQSLYFCIFKLVMNKRGKILNKLPFLSYKNTHNYLLS